MKRFKIFFSLIFFLTLGLFCHLPVSAKICNRVVAIVNSEVITLYELNTKTKELTGLDHTDLRRQDEARFFETRRRILDALIDEKIAHEKIRELGIEVAPSEVDAAIEKIKRNNYMTHEDLIIGLKKQGSSYESYRESIKLELERTRLINFEVKSKIIIREEKIVKYFNEHKDEFKTERKVHIATIVLRQENLSNNDEIGPLYPKAADILSRLDKGEDFGQLAREFSKGPGAEEGGDLGFFKTSQLDPELVKIINNMSVGDISEAIVRPSAIQIIKLVGKQEGMVKTIDKVRDAIYWILYREEVNKRYLSWINKLREKAYTKIIF